METPRTAMVFAAGLGTRLRPHTNDKPKALVTVNDMTLLEIQIRRLAAFGVERIVVNVHHFADLVEAELERLRDTGLELVVSDERVELLETGGGLRKAAPLLAGHGPFYVVNVDVLTTLDLQALAREMERTDALAVLAVRSRPTSRYLIWDRDQRLCGWKHTGTGEVKGQAPEGSEPLAFSGVQLLREEFLDLIEEEGRFSIIDTYLRLAPTQRIQGYPHDEDLWMDVGKAAVLPEAEKLLPQIFPKGLV